MNNIYGAVRLNCSKDSEMWALKVVPNNTTATITSILGLITVIAPLVPGIVQEFEKLFGGGMTIDQYLSQADADDASVLGSG